MFKTVGKIFLFSVPWIGGTSALIANKWSNSFPDEIVLGIYEDYMSPKMMKHIYENYRIRLDYFHHDQVVKDKFKSNAYGMSVVSTSILEELINENLLEKIDWQNQLNLTNGDKNSLFTDVIQKILKSSNPSFLDYGVPYFMNKLSFCYAGEPISDLAKPVKWSKLLEIIGKESRFSSRNGSPKLGMIEDPRSLLSLARFAGDKQNVNPDSGDYSDESKIYSDYYKLSEKLNFNNVFLDGTSTVLVDSLVNGDINGMISYNSDCLYASYGGNLGISKIPNKLNIADVENEIYFLDFLVISKNLNQLQREKIHKFYKDVLMSGYDSDDILRKEGDEYYQWITKNFDHVKYTPSVKKLSDKVDEKYFPSDTHTEFRKKALKIEFSGDENSIKKHYESSFSSKTKSDMLMAFLKFKERL